MATTAVATNYCMACDRYFRGASKPRWAFTAEGRPAGRVHASCLLSRGHEYIGGSINQEAAQFDLWSRYLSRPRPARNSDRYQALRLIISSGDPISETLNTEQEKRVRWWTVDGPMQLGADREDGIRAAYAELVREFLTWRDALNAQEPVPAHGARGEGEAG